MSFGRPIATGCNQGIWNGDESKLFIAHVPVKIEENISDAWLHVAKGHMDELEII